MVNWHVGQPTLKNAARTGPRFKASASESFLPFESAREIGGAIVPRGNALIALPPRNFLMEFLIPMRVLSESRCDNSDLSEYSASSYRRSPSAGTVPACTA